MGVSMKVLCIHNDEVFEIPLTKIKDGKMVKSELAGQTVLMLQISHSTKNRKPYDIFKIDFLKVSFDKNGIYDFRAEMLSEEGFRDFAYVSNWLTEALGEKSKPLPIPKAPVLPSDHEVNLIKTHLNKKYPKLLENKPHAIEFAIAQEKELYNEKIEKLKRSYKNKI